MSPGSISFRWAAAAPQAARWTIGGQLFGPESRIAPDGHPRWSGSTDVCPDETLHGQEEEVRLGSPEYTGFT
ncbi:uncharacterized protein N7458_012615 [Penicillium daleae]|uniref:Uncharacterized protein n=1 Tax=Penicillium daleae TaxID=63821 RepID=A0AAD6BV99_9EURO|nr:uncharacterized protein N7458_012615 [Penicillium daleae]KAJ5433459.1 hypothetical protein N7458_012615 [Penicillium daleae]